MNARQAIAGIARELANVSKMARMPGQDRETLAGIIAQLEALGKSTEPPKPAPKKKPRRKGKTPAGMREKAISRKAEGKDVRISEF